MTWLTDSLTFVEGKILPFLIVLTVLVFVHELGHYFSARRNGVKVQIFSARSCSAGPTAPARAGSSA